MDEKTFGHIVPYTSIWFKLKKIFFAKFRINFLAFSHFFGLKNIEKYIMSSFWSVQHPNNGLNIQHVGLYAPIVQRNTSPLQQQFKLTLFQITARAKTCNPYYCLKKWININFRRLN